MDSLDSLKADVVRRVDLWERQVFTATETSGWLVNRFAFAVEDYPGARPVVADALDAVPAPLVASMAARLNGSRVPGGGWHWPAGGRGLANVSDGGGPEPPWPVASPAQTDVLELLASWLCDIVGNPFRSAPFSPDWRTTTAVALAAQMYESREFGAMPILGDALQDAGCDSADVLEHCRGAGPHVRGCWVVDLVLGKE